MKTPLSQQAFTIMEIMIVVIIIGVIAAFAIPNYSKSIVQTHLQDAIMQLSAIRTANQVYFARTSKFWPNTAGNYNVTAINSSLSLNIIENGVVYTCACSGACNGSQFTCTAVSTDTNPFTVTLTELPLNDFNNLKCTGATGACP